VDLPVNSPSVLAAPWLQCNTLQHTLAECPEQVMRAVPRLTPGPGAQAAAAAAAAGEAARAAAGPAAAAALAEALPRELAGDALRAALEAALAAQLRGALAAPLQEAFSAAFQRTLVPAFEAACQAMFAQARRPADRPCTSRRRRSGVRACFDSPGSCLQAHAVCRRRRRQCLLGAWRATDVGVSRTRRRHCPGAWWAADACVSTGAQVQATFAGGLAEHLRAAGGATAGVAAALSGAVEQATALAAALGGELADGQRRLQQLAEDAVAAGAHPL